MGRLEIDGEAGKNTAIRNFIEIKLSNSLKKYQQKEHKHKDSSST